MALALDGVPLVEFGQDSCGAGSLSAVFNYHGDPASIGELDALLPRADGGGGWVWGDSFGCDSFGFFVRLSLESCGLSGARSSLSTSACVLPILSVMMNGPTVTVVVDYEGGGRFLCEMTDCEPDKVQIGDEVEMTFRRIFTAGGVRNYFWKARPKR